MARVIYAWKYDRDLKEINVPIYKVGPWPWVALYRAVQWWQSRGFDAEEWLSRRLVEREGKPQPGRWPNA